MRPRGKQIWTSDELSISQMVLDASGHEWVMSNTLGRRALTYDEREHLPRLLVKEMLKYGLQAGGTPVHESRAIDDMIRKLTYD